MVNVARLSKQVMIPVYVHVSIDVTGLVYVGLKLAGTYLLEEGCGSPLAGPNTKLTERGRSISGNHVTWKPLGLYCAFLPVFGLRTLQLYSRSGTTGSKALSYHCYRLLGAGSVP